MEISIKLLKVKDDIAVDAKLLTLTDKHLDDFETFWKSRQRGSHIVLVRENPKNTVIVPNHKELDRGTLRAIIRQADLTVEEFIQLLR
jgi:predicted RNA binding protein YcfA (HicA-like mRNA interferase family)